MKITQACSTSHPSGDQVDGLPLVAHFVPRRANFRTVMFSERNTGAVDLAASAAR